MAALDQLVIGQGGVKRTLVSASGGGDTVIPGSGSFISVKNADASPTTVTIAVPFKYFGHTTSSQTVAVPAGEEWEIPVGDEYRNKATGRAAVTYSKVTSLTVGSFRR